MAKLTAEEKALSISGMETLNLKVRRNDDARTGDVLNDILFTFSDHLLFFTNLSPSTFLQAIETVKPKKDTLFAYYDGDFACGQQYEASYRTMSRALTNRIGDKQLLGEMINDMGIAPRIYTSTEAALKRKPPEHKLWFVKYRCGTGGRDMQCVTTAELRDLELKTHHIIQEAVENIDLFEGKKYILRQYVLIFNKKIGLYKHGHAVLHSVQYEKGNANHDVQIQHNNQPSDLKVFDERFPSFKTIRKNTVSNLKKFKRCILNQVINKSSRDTYCILGLDYIVKEDKKPLLLEANTWPNFVNPPGIDHKSPEVPMIRDVVSTVIGIKGHKSEFEEL